MAFPTISTIGAWYNTNGTDATSHAVSYPSGVTSGDLLLLLFMADGTGGITWDATANDGFTEVFQYAAGAASTQLGVAYRIANGSEGSSSTQTTALENVTAQMLRITSWHGTTPPESSGSPAEGTSANPDPPSTSVSWGSADTLWVAVNGMNGGTAEPSVYPLPDNNDFQGTGGSGAAGGAWCSDQIATNPENPGTFTQTSQTWIAETIGIRPTAAPPWTPETDADETLRVVGSGRAW